MSRGLIEILHEMLGEGLKPGSLGDRGVGRRQELAGQAQSDFRKAGASDVIVEEISARIAAQL